MTMLPPPGKKKLGLVIDLDICVGCHACAVACKEWNDGGEFGPLPDEHAYAKDPLGVWFNRVHTYEVAGLGTRDPGLGKSGYPAIRSPAREQSPDVRIAVPESRVPSPESRRI